jgi:benzoyl-CoA reductase/2-hydroxyglutaryl-CoA dehydratase subunit BcrC/BadD/HgdB
MDYQRFNPSQFGQEYNYQRPNGIAGLDISNLYADASLRNTLDNIFNPNLNVDKALDKEEEKRQREQELLQELRMII